MENMKMKDTFLPNLDNFDFFVVTQEAGERIQNLKFVWVLPAGTTITAQQYDVSMASHLLTTREIKPNQEEVDISETNMRGHKIIRAQQPSASTP